MLIFYEKAPLRDGGVCLILRVQALNLDIDFVLLSEGAQRAEVTAESGCQMLVNDQLCGDFLVAYVEDDKLDQLLLQTEETLEGGVIEGDLLQIGGIQTVVTVFIFVKKDDLVLVNDENFFHTAMLLVFCDFFVSIISHISRFVNTA